MTAAEEPLLRAAAAPLRQRGAAERRQGAAEVRRGIAAESWQGAGAELSGSARTANWDADVPASAVESRRSGRESAEVPPRQEEVLIKNMTLPIKNGWASGRQNKKQNQ